MDTLEFCYTLLYHHVVILQIFINLQKISHNKSLDGEGILGDVPKKLGLGLQVLGT
jgi:hypothetical protein